MDKCLQRIEDLLKVIPSKLHASPSPEETKKIIDLLSEKWKALEELHTKYMYLPGINERKRLEEVQNRYSNLKRGTHDVINECEGFLQKLGYSPGNVGMNPGLPDQDVELDDNVSVYSKSTSVSGSSRKKCLKRVLVSKMKLDLARARAKEEAEAARMAYEHKQRMELRRLEEEASLAELEWKIETGYNDEGGLTPSAAVPLDATTFLVDRRPQSTPATSEKVEACESDANPGAPSASASATKILQGDIEREANVATNLKRIVGRLPNDLIIKWQNENYEIVKSRRSPQLKDIAAFVKRQASIRNDPVFGGQMLKRENKEPKLPPKPPMRNPTIGAADLETKHPATGSRNCGVCKSKHHKLQHCPIIKKCEHVAVRRQYAASCGFCFNCGVERPGHGSGSCPERPACSKCPGRHLSILHMDKAQDGHRPNPPYNRESNDKGVKPPATSHPAGHEGANTSQAASSNSNKPEPIPISSAGLSTTETQVLLNAVPVIITAANGNTVSTYAFLDSGCTDTLIDRGLVDHLGIQGIPEQIGINTIAQWQGCRIQSSILYLEFRGEFWRKY